MAISESLQEVVLVEHYAANLPLNVLDLAAWAKEFSEFQHSSQLPWLPPVKLAPPGPVAFDLIQSTAELPRILLRSSDGSSYLQLQGDRFAYGWSRPGPVGVPIEYPGFDTLLGAYLEFSQRFRAWCQQRFGSKPTRRLVELSYNNAASLVSEFGDRKISDIFKWVTPSRPVNSFQVVWMELIGKSRPDGARVSAVVAVGSAPPIDRALIHNFTGYAPIDLNSDQTIEKVWQLLHTRILEMYNAVIKAN
jgi:hypothetical protein